MRGTLLQLVAALAVANASPALNPEAMVPKPITPDPAQKAPVPKGLKIQYVGHSFHQFLPSPVASLAKEAGIQGHVTLGFDMLPASYPCQHWNKNPNTVKSVLTAGKADILTLASRELAPDPCIPKFAELAYKGKKSIKVMVQETWLPVSTDTSEGCTRPTVGPGGKNPGINTCKNRDAASYKSLEDTRAKWESPFRDILRTQLKGINTQLGSNVTRLVTIWDGVLGLRELVVKGKVPGVAKQSSLFIDGLGHATKPLQDLASYMWFIALYGVNPIGFKSIAKGGPDQAKVLQTLAWETANREPLTRIKGVDT